MVCPPKSNLRKNTFLLETYIEDVKQDEKHMPVLLESIMKGSGPEKVALRPILFKMTQIMSKIPKMVV